MNDVKYPDVKMLFLHLGISSLSCNLHQIKCLTTIYTATMTTATSIPAIPYPIGIR